jgi:hypothetical protein
MVHHFCNVPRVYNPPMVVFLVVQHGLVWKKENMTITTGTQKFTVCLEISCEYFVGAHGEDVICRESLKIPGSRENKKISRRLVALGKVDKILTTKHGPPPFEADKSSTRSGVQRLGFRPKRLTGPSESLQNLHVLKICVYC